MYDLIDDIAELIYVSDPETYELLYINKVGLDSFGIKESEIGGHLCYKLLQGRDSPCPYCTNHLLKKGECYTWRHTNPLTGGHYMLSDRLIDWKGKPARFEIAIDVTEAENERIELKNSLAAEQMVMRCVNGLAQETDLRAAVENTIRQLGESLCADRAYIFSVKKRRLYNVFEWCAPGVEAQKDNLQNLDLSLIRRWGSFFERDECVITEDLEQLRETYPDEYEILLSQKIRSMVVVPLKKGKKLTGFLGIDNPPSEKIRNIAPLMQTLRYFLMSTVRRMEDEEKLKTLSFHDSLTNAFNRNRFMTDIEAVKSLSGPVGVVYMDVNGLKEINDGYGHASGDAVLIACAKGLKKSFPDAAVYRIGGDEFVALRRGIAEQAFLRKVERLRARFPGDSFCRVAIGARWAKGVDDFQAMLLEADTEMYEDKRRFYRGKASESRYRYERGAKSALERTADKEKGIFAEYNMLMSALKVSVSKHLMTDGFEVVWANDYYYHLTGYTRQEYDEIFHASCAEYYKNDPEDYAILSAAVQKALDEGRNGYEATIHLPRKSGPPVWIRVVGVFIDEKLNGIPLIYTTFTDVTDYVKSKEENQAAYEKMRKLAYEDPVTGGGNRACFEREAGAAIASAPPDTYSLVSLDIQKFKVINDMFGIAAGDRTLKFVYDHIAAQLEPREYIARIAADTFCLLLAENDRVRIEHRVQAIAEEINTFNLLKSHKYLLTFSAGIFPIDDPFLPMTVMQDRANVARKRVKARLDSRLCSFQFYSNDDRLLLSREKELENYMRDALQNDEFIVYLQPKQNLKTGQVAGAEALVRWRKPDGTVLPPDNFVPLFERNGFIVELDHYVFGRVCALMKEWRGKGYPPLPVSVNMSRAHLINQRFLQPYEEIRRQYGIDPCWLEFELTETLVFENPGVLESVINQIHDHGYRCSMDDFGAGFSSLNTLKDILVDTLKLDRAFFASGQIGSQREADIIMVVLELARKLNMTTVAEGVETPEQAAFLRTTGCDMIQGYLFSRPVPPAEFERLVLATNLPKVKLHK